MLGLARRAWIAASKGVAVMRGRTELTIGIDFDGTFGADPEMFAAWVEMLRSRGHRAVLVTARAGTAHDKAEVKPVVGGLPIVWAGSEWKRRAAARAGWVVDIWIDDLPEYVGTQAPSGQRVREVPLEHGGQERMVLTVQHTCGTFALRDANHCHGCGAALGKEDA